MKHMNRLTSTFYARRPAYADRYVMSSLYMMAWDGLVVNALHEIIYLSMEERRRRLDTVSGAMYLYPGGQ